MLENFDTHTYGDKRVDHYIQYHVNHIFEKYFIKENVTVQAQILKGLLSLRKLKEATTLLGIRKSTKDKKMKENVIQNINSAINSIRRSRQKNVSVVRRAIHIVVVSSSTKENYLVKYVA